MVMNRKKILSLIILSVFLFACSAVQQTTKDEQTEKKEPEIYVFDDVSAEEDTTQAHEEAVDSVLIIPEKVANPAPQTIYEYIVQVGAFSNEDRAKFFVSENKTKLDFPLNISFSKDVGYWVVQLPAFASREEAEKIRDQLWNSGDFDDAFILTTEKE